ncbi:MAG TPA: 1-acyl-sn-glycerol-3-phosphate acyltransferase [Cyclobacteriaceae bacterium]|nr:1-acyl-sn-glycerol-3-phosphate acyltransferase [Cyclobacteriaceae bacterium]
MFRPFFLLCYKIFGWKINGSLPPEKKYLCCIAPHTSNWDFLVGVAARSILRITGAKFLGKSQLFRAPYGWIFRAIGGIPVERTERHDMVEQVSAIIRNSDEFILAIAPEGTRRKVTKLKTGFWYIARSAGIPIVPVGLDFKKREVVIGKPLYTTDIDSDIHILMEFYRGITGRNPELGID